MGALSDVLAAIKLDGAVYIKAEFKAPWCVETQYGLHTAATRLPRADHIVFFHLLTTARAKPGSWTVTRRSRSQPAICSCSRMITAICSAAILFSPAPVDSEAIEGLIEMRWGGDGEATRFICGPARWHCHARRLPSASPR